MVQEQHAMIHLAPGPRGESTLVVKRWKHGHRWSVVYRTVGSYEFCLAELEKEVGYWPLGYDDYVAAHGVRK
jgi:hypothetical protein